MKFQRRLGLIAIAAALCGIPAAAQSQGATALEGAWSAHITQQNQPPGAAAAFDTLITYSRGGTTVEQNGAPGFGPAVGAWAFKGGSQFVATWIKPIYDPANGSFSGTVRIRAQIRMGSPDEYESDDVVQFFLPNGSPGPSWTSTVTGRRIKAE